jgi:hypothetical protein
MLLIYDARNTVRECRVTLIPEPYACMFTIRYTGSVVQPVHACSVSSTGILLENVSGIIVVRFLAILLNN